MHLTTYRNAGGFLARMQGKLGEDEVANNLMLGIALRLHAHPEHIQRQPYFAVVEDEGGLIAAALMTPPHSVIVFEARSDAQLAYTRIAHDLHENAWPISGAIGPSEAVNRFLEVWTKLTEATVKHVTRERVFQLDNVIAPQWPSGAFRVAAGADVETLAEWMRAFQQEALPENPHQDPIEWATRRVGEGELFVWEDEGKPVSFAGRGRETTHAASIGPVYTPPEYRGRGYATACTAMLSQLILDSGKKYCMLFTDLANPTSNSIYQKIGYRPVCDYNEYIFA
jgi:hypothetical protein